MPEQEIADNMTRENLVTSVITKIVVMIPFNRYHHPGTAIVPQDVK
ncbi:MAG: hypothetical protein SVY53_01365 [Chloroflexota bacterium]|nr:hypothetical protein [Chloroflexota bacterium]